MPKLSIDGREIEVEAGATVLHAARALGIPVPTLCHREGFEHSTSCMICLVRIDGGRSLAPSCATPASEGMVVESETEDIRAARRTALELILSDHAGDCVAPCQRADPQHADIPRFLAQVAGGDVEGAAETLAAAGLRFDDSEEIAATAAEKACRRARYEETVDIGGLIRFVANRVEKPPEGATDPEPYRRFSVRLGKLDETEIATMLAAGASHGHVSPTDPDQGYDEEEARAEAERCLSCGCAVSESCRLRYWSEHLGVRPTAYRGEHRHFAQDRSHPEIIHEPGKCISCGLCIQAAERAGESLGLAFSGRGFDMRLVAPFGVPLAEALKISALNCAAVCPTGALAPRRDGGGPVMEV